MVPSGVMIVARLSCSFLSKTRDEMRDMMMGGGQNKAGLGITRMRQARALSVGDDRCRQMRTLCSERRVWRTPWISFSLAFCSRMAARMESPIFESWLIDSRKPDLMPST